MSCREVSRAGCLELLARARVGRVVLLSGALPDVVPVSYCRRFGNERGRVLMGSAGA